jgi:hypothetical protein
MVDSSSTTTTPLPIANLLPPIAASGLTLDLQLLTTLPPSAPPGSTLANVEGVIASPVSTDGLFVLDQRGIIYRTDTSGATPTVFLDLRSLPGFDATETAENGLVGLAFDPNFDGNPALPGYGTFYTDTANFPDSGTADFSPGGTIDHLQTITAWTMTDPNATTFSGTSRVVLTLAKTIPSHNGATIAFDPNAVPGSADYGLLYIGVGDDGEVNDPANNAQNVESPYGKILRIDPHQQADGASYGIPADNPFVGEGGAAPLVWALGLRNPEQFSWEQGGQDRMFIDDIGQNQVEEIDLGVAGANYGWNLRQGDFATGVAVGTGYNDLNAYPLPPGSIGSDGLTYPIAEYSHTEYSSSVVATAIAGGFMYHGTDIPELVGMYVFSDLVQGRLFFINPNAGSPGVDAPIESIALNFDGTTYNDLDASPLANHGYNGERTDMRLGEDNNGELYVMFKGPGSVYRLVDDAVSADSNACYAAGTRIRTERGEIAVEDLAPGDTVQVLSGEHRPLRWIGRRRVACRSHPHPERVLPILVQAHAFGTGLPARDLLLSPDHAVFLEGVLVPIKHLQNGSTVLQIVVDVIVYHHIELATHDVVLAEGLPAETYLETGARFTFDAQGATALHPEFGSATQHSERIWEAFGYAPLVVAGTAIERIRTRLALAERALGARAAARTAA